MQAASRAAGAARPCQARPALETPGVSALAMPGVSLGSPSIAPGVRGCRGRNAADGHP